MKWKKFFTELAVFFTITFVVAVLVSLFYNLIAHNRSVIDWPGSFRTAILFALVFPIVNQINRKR